MKIPYALIKELQDATRFTARPSRAAERTSGRTTVADPRRKEFPEIYRSPRTIVEESARQVAPENPLMRQLFGVGRQDLDDMMLERIKARGGPYSDRELWVPPKGGPAYTEQLMTPANTERVQDIVTLARHDPRFAGNFGWYETDPLLQAYIRELGDLEGTRRYMRHHGIGSAFSPGSDVTAEIRRNSMADYIANQGGGAKFLDMIGPEQLRQRGRELGLTEKELKKADLQQFIRGNEELLPPGYGHIYHSSSHQAARPELEGTGSIVFDPKTGVKTNLYQAARTGAQTKYPTPDAHFGRAIGMPDVRTRTQGTDSSLTAGEYYPTQKWFREDVLKGTDIPGSPGQSLLWNAAATSTGVKTKIGAPYLELLTNAIEKRAKQLKANPQDVLRSFLRGTEHLGVAGLGTGLVAGGLFGSDEAEAAAMPHILEALRAGAQDPGSAVTKGLDALRKQILESHGGGERIFDKVDGWYTMPEEYAGELQKLGLGTPRLREAKPEEFYAAIAGAKEASPYGSAVTLYEPKDYEKMKLFVDDTGMGGFAVKPDGDIVSVFNHPANPNRKSVQSMLTLALEEGGGRLDAFDPVLPNLYQDVGFRPNARVPFDPNYAPEGWKPELQGQPDVVALSQDLRQPAIPRGPARAEAAAQTPRIPDYDMAMARNLEQQQRSAQALAELEQSRRQMTHGPKAEVPAAAAAVAGLAQAFMDPENFMLFSTPRQLDDPNKMVFNPATGQWEMPR